MLKAVVNKDLEMRILEKHHTLPLYNLIIQNKKYLARWMTWIKETTAMTVTEQFITRSLQEFIEAKGTQAGIWYQKELAGCIGYYICQENYQKASIGYWLSEELQGKGIISNCCRYLLDYLFFDRGLEEVEIRCGTENIPSQKIPQRLGFTKDRIIKNAEKIGDLIHDYQVYKMTAAQWTQNPAIDFKQFSPILSDTAKVTLQEITDKNLRAVVNLSNSLDLRQKNMVASNAVSLAQALISKNAYFRAVYADETPVGFIMLEVPAEYDKTDSEKSYFLWRFMIGTPYQKKGYGQQALQLIIDDLKHKGVAELYTSCGTGPGSPLNFYKKLGFDATGEVYSGEMLLVKKF